MYEENRHNGLFDILSVAAVVLAVLALAVGAVLPNVGSLNFNQVEGVSVAGPVDGQVLMYNAASGKWVNMNVSVPLMDSYAVENLTDVSVANPVNGQVIVFDAVSGRWVNRALSVVPLVQGGVSGVAFNVSEAGVVTEVFVFEKAFSSVPAIVVGLSGISDLNAVLVDVEAVNVTASGFVAKCVVSGAVEGGSASFSYVAVGAA